MNHIHDEVQIEAPVDHVWAFLCDTSHWQDWALRQETSDFSGPVTRSGRRSSRRADDGLRDEGDEHGPRGRAAEAHPPAERLADGRFYRFESEGDATRMTVEADYEMPGHIPGFLKNLMTKSWFDRQTRHSWRLQGARRGDGSRPGLTHSHRPRRQGRHC